jgi:hypothetical protein
MVKMEFLFHMIKQTLWGLLYAWPITVVLIIALIIALAYNSPIIDKDYKRSYLLLLLPFSLTILIMLSSLSPWSAVIAILLVLAHVPTSALLVKRFWQYQMFVAVVGAFQMWVSMVAAFMGSVYGIMILGQSVE